MERLKRIVLAKLLYGLLFVAVLPLLLVVWAARTSQAVPLPVLHSLPWGIVLAVVGLGLILWGMGSLWWVGGGLPMNAFPPPCYVSTGIYSVFSHPIYVGFGCACVGIAVALGSPSGLWLVSTTMIIAAAALVLGYELPDMQSRYADAIPTQPLLPVDDQYVPTTRDRIRCYLTVLLPWFLLYESVIALGVPGDAMVAYFPFEAHWPVLPWTEVLYGSVYVVVLLAPLIIRTRHDLRMFSIRALLSMLVVFPIYLAVPLIAPPRSFIITGTIGHVLSFDRLHDGAAAAFPSYHVIWAYVVAGALGRKTRQRLLWFLWATLVAVSCLTTGMHAVVDVIAGLAVALLVTRADWLWEVLRNSSQTIANSWREWRFGPIRIINHGAYAGAGVFLGMLIVDTLLGPRKSIIAVSIFAGGTIGGALWAQFIEGSPSLLRPLGFYGGMLGTTVGAVGAALWTQTSIWQVLSALVVAAPWIQGLGRLRCLVQGCCHGRPTSEYIGIRYVHPRSRVCRITSLRDVPIHPTPLYSLLWNVVVAMLVTRLYLLHTTAAMVGGVYLILSSMGRFVEEAYRGEPQTPIFGGLRLYQWIAVFTAIVGAVITTLLTALTPIPVLHSSSILVALGCALAAWIVSGVDFPESNRRFARLA